MYAATFLQARDPVSAYDTGDRFDKMQKAKEIQVLIDGLQVIEKRLVDLRLGTDDRIPVIDADIKLTKLVALHDLGDGMNRMADLILAMHEVSDGMIFIDEIENGLHYTVHTDIWKVINELSLKRRIQVFATTHSLEMIRAAYEAFSEEGKLDEFRYHRLDRDSETREIEAVTYNELDMNAVATFDFDFEVRG